VAVRHAIPFLVIAALPVSAATTINSQSTTYTLSGPGPFDMPSPNNITVTSGAAIDGDTTQDWQVTVEDGATVDGASYGLSLGSASGNTLLNLGGDVTTTGSGSGGNAAGVRLTHSGTLNILSTGSINSNSDGIFLTTGGTVNNSGSVSGADGGTSVYFSSGTGVYNGDSNSVIGGGYGIIVDAGTSTITNAGTIDLLHNGVWFRGSSSGSVDNQAGGIIHSTSTSNYGIEINASGVVTITNEGAITGNTGIILGTSGHTLTNSGAIIGTGGTAISLTGNNNTVTLDTGSDITGNIAATGTGNTLTLNGQGTLNSNVTGVQSITAAADVGQSWLLNGTSDTTGTTNQALHVQSGTLILNGALTNSGAGGGTTIDGDATLQLGNNSNFGSVTGNIVDNGTLRFSRTDDVSIGNAISGSGSVNQAGNGQTTLTTANTYSGGTVVDAGTLNAADHNALGSGNVTINSGGTLALSFNGDAFTNTITNNGVLDVIDADNTLVGNITGTGESRISALTTTIDGDNSGFSGLWNIVSAGSAFIHTAESLGAGTIQLAGVLNIVPATGGFLLSNALTGTGLLKIALTGGNAFDFTNTVGTLFTGTMAMGAGTFSLDGVNTQTLTNATLQLDPGSTTTVGSTQQNIGNLTFNGGILRFPDLPGGVINTGNLTMTSGTVRVDPNDILDTSNLLRTDDGAGVQLVTSTGTAGAASNLTLQDLTGNTLTTSQANIVQGVDTVAVATYSNFGLNGSGGLAVGYTLSQLDIQPGQTLTLSGDAATPSGAADMKALLIGSGNLVVNATEAITLANAGNTYTGTTTVTGGTLRAGAVNVIDDSSQVTLNSGTAFDLNGFDQSVNNLNGTGNVTLGANTLTENTAGTVTYSGVISGTGAVTAAGPGTWILTGDNNWTGGTTIDTGVLQLGAGGTSGGITGDITNNGTLVINRSNALTLAGSIDGTGTVTQSGTGETTLSGVNSYSGGTTVSAGTLNAASATALGTGAASVSSGATLDLTFSSSTISNAIANAGRVEVTGVNETVNSVFTGAGENRIIAAGTVLGGNNSGFTGYWNIVTGATANVGTTQNLGDAAVQLDGTLNIAPASGNYTFTNTLTGTGLMTGVLASGSTFAFDNTVGSAWSGTLRLGQSNFDLTGNNTTTLTNATLQLDANNTTTVGSGTQNVGNLTMNGGALIFNGEVPPGLPDGSVAVTDLTLTSGEIRTEAPVTGIPNPAPTGQNLMEEDDREILSRLVSASGTVSGAAGNLTLTDHDGNAISDPQQFAITEGGTAVANATYNYSLSTGTGNDGLYIQYGLTTLDLLSAQTLHLTPDAGAVDAAATLSAQVTGGGNLDVDASAAGGQTVTLSNSSNNYTGATTVSGGTLRLGSNQALGNTSLLTINSGANTSINGMTQTIGTLAGDGGLAINGGNLTISNGGTFGGVTSGALGALKLTGGTLTLTGANTFTGVTTLDSGATLQVGAGGTTGSYVGPVVDNGTLTFNRSNNVALTGAVTGSGELHQDGAGTLFVNTNVGVTGPVVINAGTLSIGDGTTDGNMTSSITNNSALQFNRSDWTYGGVISGAGTVEQVSASQTTLTGANTYSGATTVSAGTLNAANVAALGTSAATVDDGATLALSFGNDTFGNAVANNGLLDVTGAGNTLTTNITGTGVNRVSALQTTLAGDNSGFNGSWDITRSGGATITAQQNLGGSPVQLDGILNVSPASGFTFINALTGSGLLAATMGSVSDAFNFAASAGSAFTGIVALRRGTMALEGDNASALTNATLSLGTGAVANLNSDQTIGNLTFAGGLLDVAMKTPDSADILTVNNLNVDSAVTPPNVGVVNLQTAALPPGAKPDGNFLDQDNEVDNGIQVVKATTVSSEGTQLKLLLDGTAPADEVDQVSDGFGHDDVLATYGYTAVMTAGANAPGGPGLYAGYMLKVLNSQSTAVIDTAGATDNTLGAQLTGVGDFDFRANDGTITLANTANDYQGKTLVTSGTLQLGGNNTLGQTSALYIAASAITDINGFSQNIGALNGAAGSTLTLNGGALTITNGGQSDGVLTGGGNLNLAGGELTVSNANRGLTATVDIADGATAHLKNADALGSGDVALNGTLVLDSVTGSFANALQGAGAMNLVNASAVTLTGNNARYSGAIDIDAGNRLTAQQAANLGSATLTNDGELVLNARDNWAFASAMSGSGLVTKAGAGVVTLASDYGHTGGTHVEAGTLALDNSAAALSGGGAVTVDEGATLGLYGKIVGNVTSRGTVSAGDAITSLTGGAGNLTIQGNLDNFNTVNLAGNSVGNTLTVTGNYTAHSTLVLNTVLGGDNSKTDKLVVQGDTRGHTDVYVNNKGGSGAQTVNGIRVIEVDGASNGDFTLANRVVAGAYDYQLFKGTPTSSDGDWYLRVPVEQPVVPIRPEAGAYLGNQIAAMDMFTHSLHDRLGESLFVTGNGQQVNAPSAWIRTFGNRTDSRSAGQIGQDTWSNGMQLGFDLASNLQVQNRWQVGVMAGYGSARTRNQSDGQSTVARSEVDGYSVGLYGTWFADGRPEGTGPYIDTWTQYGWYNNKVNGDGLPEQKYDSTTQTVSVEGGWAFNVYNTSLMSFFVQPQEQVIYTHYDADDVKEDNGTKVKMNDGGFSNRLGVRVYGYSADRQGRQWQPFIEVNWLYHGYTDAVKMDNTRLESDTPKHRYEVKAGVEAKLNNQWSLWGNIGTRQGGSEYRSVEGGLGVKYSW
jgi:autotransporter family porin